MRVAMLNRRDVFRIPGGDTTQMLRIGACLERRGVQVSYLTLDDLPDCRDYDIVHVFNRLTLQELPDSFIAELKDIPLLLTANFWFSPGPWFFSAAQTQAKWRAMVSLLGSGLTRRLYLTWHNWRWRKGVEALRLVELMRRCSSVITNSHTEREFLLQLLGSNAEIAVVPVGVDIEKYQPQPQPSARFYAEHHVEGFVLQVARIQPNKNQLALIEALSGTSVPLVFVGQPSPYQTQYVRSCVSQGEQRGNVVFAGYWPEEDLPEVYALASVHALPSWGELPGIVSLEAGAAGCRVVSTKIGCAQEYLGDDAFFCDPASHRSIREAVVGALGQSPSNRLREKIMQNYTWDQAAEAALGVYLKILRA